MGGISNCSNPPLSSMVIRMSSSTSVVHQKLADLEAGLTDVEEKLSIRFLMVSFMAAFSELEVETHTCCWTHKYHCSSVDEGCSFWIQGDHRQHKKNSSARLATDLETKPFGQLILEFDKIGDRLTKTLSLSSLLAII